MFDCVDFVVVIVYLFMKEYFKEWDFFKDCIYGIEIIFKWKSFLEND